MAVKQANIALVALGVVLVLVVYQYFLKSALRKDIAAGVNRNQGIADPSPDGDVTHSNVNARRQHVTGAITAPPLPWIPPLVPEALADLDQNDLTLAQHIRDKWIFPPSKEPRNFKNPDQLHYSQSGQSKFVDKLLKERTNGFFIECGAANGESLSNSLFFEKSRNWNGVLIEANPKQFDQILSLHRRAYALNACLSPDRKPGMFEFRMAWYIGGLADHMAKGHVNRINREVGDVKPVKIQCFPLAAILRALNVTHVDYFSLDIEGAEYEILKDFPFDEIQVDVLTIECTSGKEQQKKISDLMVGRYGYKTTDYHGFDIMLTRL